MHPACRRHGVLLVTLLLLLSLVITRTHAVARCPGSPNQCSLHGACVLNRLGQHVCNCEWGYDGHDCSKKMCPHGFDPTSSFTDEKKLRLVIEPVAGSAPLQGTLVLTFHAHSVAMEMPLSAMNSDTCTKVFQRFQNIARVSCERIPSDGTASAVFEVTLHAFPMEPIMNNLYRHNGNPLSSDFWCDASGVTSTTSSSTATTTPSPVVTSCRFESMTDLYVKEYAACSNHGLCDARTGLCTCDRGFHGAHCGSDTDDEDIQLVEAPGPFFHGHVLRVSAQRAMTSEFMLLQTQVAGLPVFSLRGDGLATFHGANAVRLLRGSDLELAGGSVRLAQGGAVALDQAELTVVNGHIHVRATTPTVLTEAPLLLLELPETKDEPARGHGDDGHHTVDVDVLRISRQRGPLLRVTRSGSVVVHDGGIEVLAGGVRVQRGGLHVLSEGVRILHGDLLVQNGKVALQSGDMTVQRGHLSVSSPLVSADTPQKSSQAPKNAVLTVVQTGTTAALSSASTVLQLAAEDADAVLLSAGHRDVDEKGVMTPSFQVHASGETEIRGGGLYVAAGGITVGSGGQTIHSGGLHVASGGIHVASGRVTTQDGFEITDGGLHVATSAVQGAALSLSSPHPQFAGQLVSLLVNQSQETPTPFHLIAARRVPASSSPASAGDTDTHMNDEDLPPSLLFAVNSDGSVASRGDISTHDGGRVVADGALISRAQVVLEPAQLLAGPTILIPSGHSYVEVTDDGTDSGNMVTLPMTDGTEHAGQLLVLQNADAQRLRGDVSVKPGDAAIFVCDGRQWRALTAASVDTSVLTGVQQLEAANDLNLGAVKLTAQRLQAAGQRAGRVALYTRGGELSASESLRFDTSSDTLSVATLEVQALQGRVDMSGSELRGISIAGGHIHGVNMTDIALADVRGELFVGDAAYFGAGITVDGQVMGSGAYIDASDRRFKREIVAIKAEDAAAIVAALQGVEYGYRVEQFPAKRFGARRELGLIAQEVEKVLPQVVVSLPGEEDEEGQKEEGEEGEEEGGFKYVAYARIVPVLVEALKAEQQVGQTLREDLTRVEEQLRTMAEQVARQQEMLTTLMTTVHAAGSSGGTVKEM